ncbi:MAG: hypothetical protein H0T92_05560 [Pyrinomonadaceae bacterium]|nr:hypothetical protein [Pyrinomonadaceae bacterium]
MSQEQTPHWQPVSFLPQIAEMIDGMLESAAENHRLLQQARPGSLDDATVERVVRVYTTQRDDLRLYIDQLSRWEKEPLDEKQSREVARLQQQLDRLRRVLSDVLVLAEKLKELTIERLLSRSDAEIGLDFLLGKLRF